MNIDKTIEILQDIYMKGYKLTTKDHYAALKLGIEALKRVQDSRVQRLADFTNLLPGETE